VAFTTPETLEWSRISRVRSAADPRPGRPASSPARAPRWARFRGRHRTRRRTAAAAIILAETPRGPASNEELEPLLGMAPVHNFAHDEILTLAETNTQTWSKRPTPPLQALEAPSGRRR
jgi:hypothetical protein